MTEIFERIDTACKGYWAFWFFYCPPIIFHGLRTVHFSVTKSTWHRKWYPDPFLLSLLEEWKCCHRVLSEVSLASIAFPKCLHDIRYESTKLWLPSVSIESRFAFISSHALTSPRRMASATSFSTCDHPNVSSIIGPLYIPPSSHHSFSFVILSLDVSTFFPLIHASYSTGWVMCVDTRTPVFGSV